MSAKAINILTGMLIIMCICLINCLATTLYWQHEAVVHNSAFWEANSWGFVKFKWNDVSFAQVPFQDPAIYQAKIDEAQKARLNALGIK